MLPKTKTLLAIAAIAIYLATFYIIKVTKIDNHELQVSFLDIGQGDSIYIKAPNGHDMLIDGSKTGSVLTKKLSIAMATNDKSIDIVLATHPDADHIGGLSTIIENYNVGTFIEPGVSSESKLYATLLDDVNTKQIPHVYARTGMHIVLDKENNVTFSVLEPDIVTADEDTNDASIVGILSYGDKTFMFTGDAGIPSEEKMLADVEAKKIDSLHVDVLKLGHHGSKTSSSEAFLEAVHPSTAIISAGCKNAYGHPNKEVVDRVYALKILMYATCTSGTITYYTDGKTLSRETEK